MRKLAVCLLVVLSLLIIFPDLLSKLTDEYGKPYVANNVRAVWHDNGAKLELDSKGDHVLIVYTWEGGEEINNGVRSIQLLSQ